MKKEILNRGLSLIWMLPCLFIFCFCLAGCEAGGERLKKLQDLDFTVVSEERLPEELKEIVEGKKEEPFKLTYVDEEYLYICAGYGKQPSGGYSIAVNELYLTENAIYIKTSLLGPSPEEGKKKKPSYPYLVVKLEKRDKTVVFG